VVLLALVSLVACTESDNKSAVTGTLRMVGGLVGNATIPVDGSVEATRTNGSVAGRATAGADGQFKLSLAPGTYQLVGHSPQFNGGTIACWGSTTNSVEVTDGHSVNIDVVCPMR
jgi:hypothetical protein